MEALRRVISVKGIVQGVGFRPFVYQLAVKYNLKGQVLNNPQGVEIDVEGEGASLDKFLQDLGSQAPPLAKIEEVSWVSQVPVGYRYFVIGQTECLGAVDTLISTDVATCQDCLQELFDPEDRRYGYPFINCTNCGPRFTVTKDVPYDREYTTMKVFPMCHDCSGEYHDPADRRFHAQPNACHICGPRVILRDSAGGLVDEKNPIDEAVRLLKNKNILAVKGLGGYHLACNALDSETVSELRSRKVREDKPFGVMVADIEAAQKYTYLADSEARLLESHGRPIVLLKKKGQLLADQVAPGNASLGVMLPYTPLHHLLMEKIDFPLIMTSGNLSDEPIAYKDEDAFMRLGDIADYFLTHNREICHRCDDSVTRVYREKEYPLRRSRGYAPAPVRLHQQMGHTLAVGGEQKNTFCLTRDKYAFVSHHIGDLENLETLEVFGREIEMYKKLFHVEPDLIAYDYHPEYLSTKYAMDLDGVKKTGVQHHHAHIASCMAEYGLEGKVLGVAFDGTGFGPDGSIWGGEFLHASFLDFKRLGHLKHFPMPGGARAIKEPWRMASGCLYSIFGREWLNRQEAAFLARKNGMLLNALEEIMEKWINCPPTSSMGRLFDAVAALIGIRDVVNYEGQAAVEMEQAALTSRHCTDKTYEYIIRDENTMEVDTDGIIRGVLDDLTKRQEPGLIAYKFHHTVAEMVGSVCLKAREMLGENRVCLSGGVFQNMLLLDMVHNKLEGDNFEVYVHRVVPTNDGGVSLGQAVIAEERRREGCV